MLFHLQFPFTDLRAFHPLAREERLKGGQSATDSRDSSSTDSDRVASAVSMKGLPPRLPVPSWPAPIVAEEFVRSFGIVRQRLNGGLAGRIGEAEYCEARRALLFVASGPLRRALSSTTEVPLQIAFRRLYFDGYAVGKTEVGLRTMRVPIGDPAPIQGFVERMLSVPAAVRTVKGAPEQCLLYKVGKPLARLYAYATSQVTHDLRDRDPAPLVLSEAPILFIEVAAGEANRVVMPDCARKVLLAANRGFDLFFWRVNLEGRAISVWCIRLNRLPFDPEARSLRVYLLRLNAEHQALKRVLKAIGTGQIAPAPRDASAQLLQGYLNIATRRIGRCESKAQSYSSELDTLAFSIFDIATPGEADSLMSPGASPRAHAVGLSSAPRNGSAFAGAIGLSGCHWSTRSGERASRWRLARGLEQELGQDRERGIVPGHHDEGARPADPPVF